MDEGRKEMGMPQTNGEDVGIAASSDTGLSVVRGALTLLSVLLILSISISIFKVMKNSRKPPPKAPAIQRVLKVQVEEAVVGEYVVSVEGQGVIAAQREITIIPEVMGKVVYANPEFREGGTVRKGDLLYRIEQGDYRAAVNQARGAVTALENEISFQETQRDALTRQLARSKDSWAISNEEADRVKRLFDQGASSEAEVNGRLASEKSVMERVEQLESSLSLIDPGIERIKSNLNAARAALAKAELALERTEYSAPFTGRITGGKLETSQFAGAGQPIAKIIDDSIYEVSVPISVSDWKALAPGATADTLDVNPVFAEVTHRDNEGISHTWPGRIARIGSVLDPRTRLVDVVVEIKAAAGDTPIISGTFCTVAFKGQSLRDVVVIPRRALRGDDTVYVVNDDSAEKTLNKEELAAFSREFAKSLSQQFAPAVTEKFEGRLKEKFGYQLKAEAIGEVEKMLREKLAEEVDTKFGDALADAVGKAFPEGENEIKVEAPHQAMAVREVEVWRHEGENIVITGGLHDGDQVITSVVEEVVPGMPVVVISRNGENMVPDAKAGEFGGAGQESRSGH